MATRKNASVPVKTEAAEKPEVNRLYKTPQELSEKINTYFNMCELNGVFPDFEGMLVYLGMLEEEYAEYNKEEGFRRLFAFTKMRRTSFLSRRMTSEPKLAQGCMNAIKQEINGGYKDRNDKENDVKITIKLDGVGGEAAGK